MEFVTNFTYIFDKDKHTEKPSSKSLVVKGAAYTVRELLQKFTQGIIPQVMKEAVYADGVDLDSIDLEKWSSLDMAEQSDFIQANKEKITRMINFLEKRKKSSASDGIIENAEEEIENAEEEIKTVEDKQPV